MSKYIFSSNSPKIVSKNSNLSRRNCQKVRKWKNRTFNFLRYFMSEKKKKKIIFWNNFEIFKENQTNSSSYFCRIFKKQMLLSFIIKALHLHDRLNRFSVGSFFCSKWVQWWGIIGACCGKIEEYFKRKFCLFFERENRVLTNYSIPQRENNLLGLYRRFFPHLLSINRYSIKSITENRRFPPSLPSQNHELYTARYDRFILKFERTINCGQFGGEGGEERRRKPSSLFRTCYDYTQFPIHISKNVTSQPVKTFNFFLVRVKNRRKEKKKKAE